MDKMRKLLNGDELRDCIKAYETVFGTYFLPFEVPEQIAWVRAFEYHKAQSGLTRPQPPEGV